MQMNACGGSILRSTAKQNLAAGINLVAYYIIAVPIGYYVGVYLGYGLPGLWAALNFGLAAVSIFTLVYYNLVVNWGKEMDRAEERREIGEE